MTGSNEGARWASWLAQYVAPYGTAGRRTPVWLAEQLGEDAPTQPTISRWLRGQRPGSPALAARVGEIFGDRAGALAAAGFADPSVQVITVGDGGRVVSFGGVTGSGSDLVAFHRDLEQFLRDGSRLLQEIEEAINRKDDGVPNGT